MPHMSGRQPNSKRPAERMLKSAFDDEIKRLARRWKLSRATYEKRIVIPAVRRAERKHGLSEDLVGLAERTIRAAETCGFRTYRGVIQWLESQTWRHQRAMWRRETTFQQERQQSHVASKINANGGDVDDAKSPKSAQDTESAEDASNIAERKAIAQAARTREQQRLSEIERRRDRARRTVLGLLAAARATDNEPASTSWTTSEWERIGTWTQEQCWKVLRPSLGLRNRTFAELIQRKRESESAIRKGHRPPPDQELAKARHNWRQSRHKSWLRIGERVLSNSKHGTATPAEKIAGLMAPRGALPSRSQLADED